MTLRNTQDNYGAIARGLHWLIALLIFGLVLVGLYMTQMENSPEKVETYALHKSFGLLVLWLAGLRLIWRFWSMPPDAMESHAPWERMLAGAAHIFLYIAMIGMPLSGWIMSSASQYPVPFFGLEMPDLGGTDQNLAGLMRNVHEWLAYTLIFVIGLHVTGALKHHFLDGDSTLFRMAGANTGVKALVLVLIAGGFFAGAGFLLMPGPREEVQPDIQVAQGERTALPIAETTPKEIGRGEWAIVHGKSKLGFEGTLYDSNFSGEFEKFDGKIVFDPDRLPVSQVDIVIDMTSADTKNKERDEQIQTSEWFNTELFTEARFESLRFERGAGNQYVAIGYLTIRNVTLPVTLPFTLDIKEKANGDKVATMEGSLEINRLDFGVGQGEWSSTDTVKNPVRVNVSLTAEQPAASQ